MYTTDRAEKPFISNSNAPPNPVDQKELGLTINPAANNNATVENMALNVNKPTMNQQQQYQNQYSEQYQQNNQYQNQQQMYQQQPQMYQQQQMYPQMYPQQSASGPVLYNQYGQPSPINILISPNALMPAPKKQVIMITPVYSPYSRCLVLILCYFLGWLGIHRCFTGNICTGIIWFFTFGILGIGWVVDMCMVAAGSYRDGDGRLVFNW